MSLVSVIVPTRNRPELLARALRSIRAQTYQDFEIIVIDDGLERRADRVVSELNDKRIHYIKNETNIGNAASKNRALQHIRGDFIAVLDDDDEWLPKRLEDVQRSFEDVPEADLVYCAAHAYDEQGNFVRKHTPRWIGLVDMHAQYRQLLKRCNIYTGTWTIRRQTAEPELYFDEDYRKNQDWDFLIRLARQCTFYAIPDVLVRLSVGRRDHMGGGAFSEKHIEGLELILQKHEKGLREHRGSWAELLLQTGMAYMKAGNSKEAKKKLLKAWRLRPWNLRYAKHAILSR